MINYSDELKSIRQKIKAQDDQLYAINNAEVKYKGDLDELIRFWENLLATDGILIRGASWPFRIVEL